jgi:hypothetical protein
MRFWRRNCVVRWRHRVEVVTCAGRNIAPAQAHDLTREQRAIADIPPTPSRSTLVGQRLSMPTGIALRVSPSWAHSELRGR